MFQKPECTRIEDDDASGTLVVTVGKEGEVGPCARDEARSEMGFRRRGEEGVRIPPGIQPVTGEGGGASATAAKFGPDGRAGPIAAPPYPGGSTRGRASRRAPSVPDPPTKNVEPRPTVGCTYGIQVSGAMARLGSSGSASERGRKELLGPYVARCGGGGNGGRGRGGRGFWGGTGSGGRSCCHIVAPGQERISSDEL